MKLSELVCIIWYKHLEWRTVRSCHILIILLDR